jgi:hypothetical protein
MTAVTSDIMRKVTISIKLRVLIIYRHINWIYAYYSEVVSLPNRLERVESAAPTSRLYAFSTVIQMITEYHFLCRYAALQWHDRPTKNSEYQ